MTTRARHAGHAVEIIPFTDRFEDLLGGAAGVISMAGYNTVMEILSGGVPALLVPREAPRQEQRIRAERVAHVSDIEVCTTARLSSQRIGRFVKRALGNGQPSAPKVSIEGVERTVREFEQLMVTEARPYAERRWRAPAIA